jgi:hypothetical protein
MLIGTVVLRDSRLVVANEINPSQGGFIKARSLPFCDKPLSL